MLYVKVEERRLRLPLRSQPAEKFPAWKDPSEGRSGQTLTAGPYDHLDRGQSRTLKTDFLKRPGG